MNRLKFLVFAMVSIACINTITNAQNHSLLAKLEIEKSEDTIKIVRNGDTTKVITEGLPLNFDTTVVIGNDSALLNGIISRSFVIEDKGNGWELIQGDTNWWNSRSWEEFFDRFFYDRRDKKSVSRYNNEEECTENNGCKKELKKRKRILSTDFAIGYGYINWSNKDFFSTPNSNDAYSLKWSNKWDFSLILNICPDNPVWVSTGLGIQSNIFRFDDMFAINEFNNADLAGSVSKGKHKLVARYITVPLMLNAKLARNIGIHAGVIGGLNYRNKHTGFKQDFKADGKRYEISTGSSFNEFSTFKADATIGIQFYDCTFYVSHSLTDIFKDSYGKELKPFSFGVILNM
ncbi:MAG: hypothetical protein IJ681_10415 [Bacteroidales bacterium]|nr:hypothetical protein [Bacteroidales bacterium]